MERSARHRISAIHLPHRLLALSTIVVPALVYLRTMAPTVYGLDSAELSVGAYTLGLVHAPGYPLYLLLGKLFTFLPVGDVGYRMNLMSAIFGIITVHLVYRLAQRLTGNAVLAAAAALFLAFSWYFWTDAIVAEVYTLQGAFTAGLLWLLLQWRDRRQPRRLLLFAFLAGLSLANYPATGLIAPGLALFVWLTDRRALLNGRQIAQMAGLFGLGCLVYLYLPLRYLAQPAFNYMGQYDASGVFHPANLTDPAILWSMFTGGPFRDLMFGYSLPEAVRQTGQYLYFLWGNFLAVGLPIGIFGLIYGWQRDRPVAISTGLMYLVYALFFINYRVIDKHTMFLPSYVIWAVWIAWGYRALLAWAGPAWRQILPAGFVALAGLAILINYPLADVSWDRRAYAQAADMLMAAEENALILGDWGFAAPITYLQLTEGRRPDVQTINRFFITFQDTRTLIEQALARRPVYIVSVEPDTVMEHYFVVEPAGPGLRIISRRAQ